MKSRLALCDTVLHPLPHPRLSFAALSLPLTEVFIMREIFSLKGVFTTKHLVALALFLAVRTVLGLPFLTIYVGGMRLISFAYLADAAAAVLFGPWAGVAFGFAGDTLGFLASGGVGGGYMPWYAISVMVTCLIFALVLYRRNLNWPRVGIAWGFNLVLVVLGLNTLWLYMLYGQAVAESLTLIRVVVNVAQMVVHVPLTYFVLRFLSKQWAVIEKE
jgi:ECF transporter S component (folate family)